MAQEFRGRGVRPVRHAGLPPRPQSGQDRRRVPAEARAPVLPSPDLSSFLGGRQWGAAPGKRALRMRRSPPPKVGHPAARDRDRRRRALRGRLMGH
ncbi:Hypothetical Protein RSKD131_3244 [Cereibacter sphaeroides KD131]|nr:Hypothetical Protein RSKD131_3244 [Cereibacter sphaeroides KD131]